MDRALMDAWAAGLFDGEGTLVVVYGKKSRRPKPVLKIGMTDEDVVRKFHAYIERGNIYRYVRKNRNWKPVWIWTAAGFDLIEEMFSRWRPYLGLRRTERFQTVIAMRPPPYIRPGRPGVCSDEQILDIRAKYAAGMKCKHLIEMFSVSKGTIRSIVHNRTFIRLLPNPI